MRPALPNNQLHNPFNNRFNDPVTRRLDDMQAYAYMVWLRERSQATCNMQSNSKSAPSSVIVAKRTASVSDTLEPGHEGRIFAGVFALFLVLLVSVAVLLKAV